MAVDDTGIYILSFDNSILLFKHNGEFVKEFGNAQMPLNELGMVNTEAKFVVSTAMVSFENFLFVVDFRCK